MPTVAVAGGTGKLGRAIVEAISADGKFEVVILGREANEEKEKEIGARIIPADYDNVDALVALLESNKVETVISTMRDMGGASPDSNLIQAADKSSCTKRMIASLWGIEYTEHIASFFPPARGKLDNIKELQSTSLETTVVVNGFFLDYFVAPQVPSYQPPFAMVLDIANNTAVIPGSGDVPVVFTHTFDIARFIPALLSKPKWDKTSYIIGDKVTWNEFLAVAEEAKGVKFTVGHDSVETLKTGFVTELPSHPSMYAIFPKPMLQGLFASFGVMFENGAFDLSPASTLNDEFPEIKARRVKELVFEAWK